MYKEVVAAAHLRAQHETEISSVIEKFDQILKMKRSPLAEHVTMLRKLRKLKDGSDDQLLQNLKESMFEHVRKQLRTLEHVRRFVDSEWVRVALCAGLFAHFTKGMSHSSAYPDTVNSRPRSAAGSTGTGSRTSSWDSQQGLVSRQHVSRG